MFFKDDMSHCQEQIAKTVHFDQNERDYEVIKTAFSLSGPPNM